MGIRDEIQAEIAEAFNTDLDDAVHAFSGSYVIKSGWDPVTETGGETVVSYTGRGVLSGYETERIDGVNILAGDVKLLALKNEVTDVPAEGHIITAPDLATGIMQAYKVVKLGADPASATYRMQLRRK
ncbi:glutamate 5-kinase [Pantoea sp. FN060301]|uniref:glutamate 5-kinase n=1 Tax=Pantoea sp. FN060301 TaxID=3420380 RepID=UPI003D173C3F